MIENHNNFFSQGSRSRWLLALTLLLSIILLFFTFRGLDWKAFWETIRNGHYEYLLLTIPITCFNYFIRSFRWGLLVRSDGNTSFMKIFWANMVGYLGNAFLPARMGEIMRSAYLGQQNGLGTSFVLATALVERSLDAIALVLIGSSSLLLQPDISPLLKNALIVMTFFGTMALLVIISAPSQENLLQRMVFKSPFSEKFRLSISRQINRFLSGIHSLHNIRRLGLFTLLTGIIWLVDAFTNTIGVRILSQSLTIPQAFILLAALGLSSAIPSTPGYIGVYQFVAVIVLTPFGFSRANALAYILISQVINYLLVGCLGLIGLWKLNKTRSDHLTASSSLK